MNRYDLFLGGVIILSATVLAVLIQYHLYETSDTPF